jgi:hypothetical protein
VRLSSLGFLCIKRIQSEEAKALNPNISTTVHIAGKDDDDDRREPQDKRLPRRYFKS